MSGPVDLTTLGAAPSLPGARAAIGARYLVVFEGGATVTVPLLAGAALVIGRGREADVHLADQAVSREHARIDLEHDTARVTDLGSQNGTHLNGERIDGTSPLWPGDVITLGRATLVFHAGPRAQAGCRIVEFGDFRDRLERELERCLRSSRDVALIGVGLGATPERAAVEVAVVRTLRAIDTATWSGRGELLALLPELDADDAEEVAARLRDALAPIDAGPRLGVAACPEHALDADALLAAARAAALGAGPAEVASGPHAAEELELGGHRVVIAEPSMARLYALIDRLARSDLPVLVRGETGTGKELAASALHHRSARAAGPLIAVNCAALTESLAESELFGHARGAFSGAVAARTGLLEAAVGGTVFLDEIGELPLAIQAKLLRALDTRSVMRVGEVHERPIDIRLVAATNRDLRAEIEARCFRADLYFRLCGAELEVPPLRERPRDLPRLAAAFLASACAALRVPAKILAGDALDALGAHSWPGNVRELRNLMEFAAAAIDTSTVRAVHLAPRLASPPDAAAGPPAAATLPLADEVRALEIRRMEHALTEAGGNQTQAARLLGMPLRTLTYKLKRYGLGPRRRPAGTS